MYSGFTITKASGIILGAHQKIDRIARKQLENILPNNGFPAITDILKFEGDKGPDSIKHKSPFKDEPWHFFNPEDENDISIIHQIMHHYNELVIALKKNNEVKSSFEAAWLAHAMVDGLTPAHQHDFSEEANKLRGLDEIETHSAKNKIMMYGETPKEKIKNNWKMWGPKGLLTNHLKFEIGFASIIAPLRFKDLKSRNDEYHFLTPKEIADWYRNIAKEVNDLNIYNEFINDGWTIKLSQKAKDQLAPILINAVTRLWYNAYKASTE